MSYDNEKIIKLSVGIDRDLNEKIETFSDVLGISKTKLITDMINQNIYNYVKAWESLNTVDKVNNWITTLKKNNKDTSQFLRIKKVLLTEPSTVRRANYLFSELAKQQPNNKKNKRTK